MKLRQVIEKKLDEIAATWPLQRRMIVILIITQSIVVTSSIVGSILVVLHVQRELPTATPLVYVTIFAISLGVILSAMTSISVIISTSSNLTQRLDGMIQSLQNQATRSELHIALESGKQDSLGQLVNEINQLLQAYQVALEDLARRTDRLTVLNTVAATINRTFDLKETFETVLQEALKVTSWNTGAVFIWDQEREILTLSSQHGLPEDLVAQLASLKRGEGLAGQAAKTRQIIVAEDVSTRKELPYKYRKGYPITQIDVPLVAMSGELLGVFQVGNATKIEPSEEDLNLLATLAHQIALAIDKAHLYSQVRQHADELEEIVQARTEALAQAIDELSVALERAQEADRVKSLLLSTVSHELRTPLATIKGNTSLLTEYHQHITPDELVEHLRDIEEETDKLTDLINSLLEMSRIEAGVLHIQREAINLVDVLEGTVNTARVRYTQHPIELDLPSHIPIVYADPRRVEQIVDNLIDNAVKYSKAGTPIQIMARHTADEVVISVIDQGEGIKAEFLPKIFDRFYQVKGAKDGRAGDSYRKGIGLGLAICRGLVEAHEGRIWAESEVEKGSTFYFSLPIATAEWLKQRSSA